MNEIAIFSHIVGNIGDLVDSVRFLNGPSNINSDMKFNFLQQCALYVEPENFTKTVHGWVTPRYTPVNYLYQSPSGTPPPLGMRSAVPLGGMGTGNAVMKLPYLCSTGLKSHFPSMELEKWHLLVSDKVKSSSV